MYRGIDGVYSILKTNSLFTVLTDLPKYNSASGWVFIMNFMRAGATFSQWVTIIKATKPIRATRPPLSAGVSVSVKKPTGKNASCTAAQGELAE